MQQNDLASHENCLLLSTGRLELIGDQDSGAIYKSLIVFMILFVGVMPFC